MDEVAKALSALLQKAGKVTVATIPGGWQVNIMKPTWEQAKAHMLAGGTVKGVVNGVENLYCVKQGYVFHAHGHLWVCTGTHVDEVNPRTPQEWTID